MSVRTMQQRWTRGQTQAAALSLFALSCILATAVVIIQVFVRLEDYGTANQDSILWTISRLEVDQLNVSAAIERVRGPVAEDLETLRRRFDVLYSRAALLHEGQIYREVLSSVDAMTDVAFIVATLDNMVPVIDSDDASLFAARDVLLQRISDLSGAVHRIASSALTIDARRSDAERSALIYQIVVLSILSLAMVAALLVLLLLVWRLYQIYRQRAEEHSETSQRLATILDTSQDAVLVVRPDGIVTDCNAVAHTMLALSPDPSTPIQVSDFLRRRQADGRLVPLSGAHLIDRSTSGPRRCANVVLRDRKGHEFQAEVSTAIARNDATTVCICFIRDISDRLAAEAEIAAARDRALSGERAKARFLSVISHEMRTPLNGLLGALDLLAETPLAPDQKRYAKVMKSSGQLLLTQINDALDTAQAESGQLVLRRAEFDLDQMLRDLVETQHTALRARNNRLRLVCCHTTMSSVLGDRNRVYQVLLNLVSNAIKFTRDGEITITAHRLERPGSATEMIEFQIRDTGIGISTEDLPQMFEDFVRLDGPDSDHPEGTGLGLGIVRDLVTRMGGAVGAESVKGEGSLFWVRIPLPDVATAASVAPLHVLVVDDTAESRLVIAAMLREDGHMVCLAQDGREAVERTAGRCFDLIVMDINMPRMNGREAAHRIRAGGGPSARARMIALTAYWGPDQKGAPGDDCFDAVETKPLRRDRLRVLLAQCAPASPPESAGSPVDADMLAQLGDCLPAERISDLLAGFSAEGRALLDDLDDLWQGPSDRLADRLHNLAGSAAITGARDVHRLLGQAEAALRADDVATARDLLAALPEIFDQTLGQFHARHRAA
ncbi:MAG: hybrid sensor histidine kinase/response regulator [Rhodobacteraceae bacterium CG17_big_fil_post_rev_8_21_14_2_50_63_15]|nr:response regulator [Roseovarius sp.]PIV78673.1 MAG: hybrid sensor histidine kinase/response regulator [Rhodobacteraceae bacterium CG17_big_fil_post_rev_8_21_14_2_50_63_15]